MSFHYGKPLHLHYSRKTFKNFTVYQYSCLWLLYLSGVIGFLAVFGPTIAFIVGARMSRVYVTLEGKPLPNSYIPYIPYIHMMTWV